MPLIETIARPRQNLISVHVPKEYGSYSFQVILVPLGIDAPRFAVKRQRKSQSFVDALLACPKLDEGETLETSRDSGDYGREIDL